MEKTKNEDKSIFVHLDLIDEMAWKDACINTNSILIVPSRDDTLNIRSKIQSFRNIAHLSNYEFSEKYLQIMIDNGIETAILLPVKDYDTLSIKLINKGFTIKILEMNIADLSNSNCNDLCKYISRSKSYYLFWFEHLSRQNDFITNPSSLEIELASLIRKLDFTKLDHIQFNNFLINMIQLENLGEPLIYNFLKKGVINTYNNNKMENK
jgi:hypothetical protein